MTLLELHAHLGYLLGNLNKKSVNVGHVSIKRYVNLLHKIRMRSVLFPNIQTWILIQTWIMTANTLLLITYLHD